MQKGDQERGEGDGGVNWLAAGETHPIDGDLPISELTPRQEAALAEAPTTWFASLRFHRDMSGVSGERLRVLLRNGEPAAVYHWEPRRAGIRELHFFGVPLHDASELRQIMRRNGAHAATFSYLTAAELAAARRLGRWPLLGESHEDIVVDLPATPEDFLRSLGFNRQKQLPKYLRRLRREFGPQLQTVELHKADITEGLCGELVALVGERMHVKGGESLWTPEMLHGASILARQCGWFLGLRLGTKLIGGTLCYMHRGEAIAWIIAHDPAYDHYKIGNICRWMSIARHIEMGCKRHRFGGGMSLAKLRFGGRIESLATVTVFNSRAVALAWHVFSLAARGSRWARVAPRAYAKRFLPARLVRYVREKSDNPALYDEIDARIDDS
jgi:hypothetical protein